MDVELYKRGKKIMANYENLKQSLTFNIKLIRMVKSQIIY